MSGRLRWTVGLALQAFGDAAWELRMRRLARWCWEEGRYLERLAAARSRGDG